MPWPPFSVFRASNKLQRWFSVHSSSTTCAWIFYRIQLNIVLIHWKVIPLYSDIIYGWDLLNFITTDGIEPFADIFASHIFLRILNNWRFSNVSADFISDLIENSRILWPYIRHGQSAAQDAIFFFQIWPAIKKVCPICISEKCFFVTVGHHKN